MKINPGEMPNLASETSLSDYRESRNVPTVPLEEAIESAVARHPAFVHRQDRVQTTTQRILQEIISSDPLQLW